MRLGLFILLLPVGLLAQAVNPLPQAVAPVTPHGETITLAWNPSTTSGVKYRLYRWTEDGSTNTVTVSGTNTTVTNVILPTWFVVRAVKNGIESDPSNTLGVLGRDEVFKVIALTNGASGLSDWRQAGVVFTGTNVTGNGFWKLDASRQVQLRTTTTE